MCFKAKKKRGCEACAFLLCYLSFPSLERRELGRWLEGATAIPCARTLGEGRVGGAVLEHLVKIGYLRNIPIIDS